MEANTKGITGTNIINISEYNQYNIPSPPLIPYMIIKEVLLEKMLNIH